jgi:glycosyltransferase involved in cell wall biosynthesis
VRDGGDDGGGVVAIALLTLVPGLVGGSETYVRELLRALGRVGSHEYRVLLPPKAPDAAGDLPHVVARHYRGSRVAAMAKASIDPRYGRLLAGCDLVHYPLTVPIPRVHARRVVTLHDVQHLDLPQLFSRAERAYRAVAYDHAARSADRVIVISEFVRRRAVEGLGLDESRVVTVPLGVDTTSLRPAARPKEPFLLYPAKLWPHKNHPRLFEAFAELRRERPGLRLVLTGGGGHGRLPEGVEDRGHVPRAAVVDLLQRASGLVFPSLYEGFGLPPLEAMACGCPVACSDRGALPEVVGDAARLFDPEDPSSIVTAVSELLDDPAPWIERGLARAALFSWDETARRTDAVYADLRT